MEELISNFGVDWKLLLAQAVNFFILFVVLKKFAYGPILRLLKKRSSEIERGLTLTKTAEERLAHILKEREEKLHKARQEALTIISEAEDKGKERKEEIVVKAQEKAEDIIEEARKRMDADKAKMTEEVYKHAAEFIETGILKVLRKMEKGERDRVLIEQTLSELKEAKAKGMI